MVEKVGGSVKTMRLCSRLEMTNFQSTAMITALTIAVTDVNEHSAMITAPPTIARLGCRVSLQQAESTWTNYVESKWRGVICVEVGFGGGGLVKSRLGYGRA